MSYKFLQTKHNNARYRGFRFSYIFNMISTGITIDMARITDRFYKSFIENKDSAVQLATYDANARKVAHLRAQTYTRYRSGSGGI